ncbi:MAG TPA: glycosyltransferase family 4 protein [Phycisphaerae bacterium]|nr:glycosyltransferase family 4 protein [Phycisphaerae bacterium]HRR84508.1 glycosyltransferase family 4 protein [Phycisphaerae bacterium]
MARALRSLGVDVRFVVGRKVASVDQPLDEFETEYIRSPYLRDVEYRYSGSPWRILRAASLRARRMDDRLFQMAALKRLLADKQADVFQVCALADLAARLTEAGRKAVVRWTGPPSGYMAGWAVRCSGSFSHGESYEAAKRCGLNPAHIVAGCDTELFRPPVRREYLRDRCEFIFVGRCVPVKNLEFLLSGFAEARRRSHGLRLSIVGDGDSLPGIRKRIAELGIADSVRLPGFLHGADLAQQYQAADCFVLVSLYESFSLVALEAMSSGLPLILSRVGHLPRFVEQHQAGSLVEPGDVQGLADEMLRWQEQVEERRRTGENNRRVIEEQYSWKSSARKLLDYYESLCRKA